MVFVLINWLQLILKIKLIALIGHGFQGPMIVISAIATRGLIY